MDVCDPGAKMYFASGGLDCLTNCRYDLREFV
jgi:hypothetical protein